MEPKDVFLATASLALILLLLLLGVIAVVFLFTLGSPLALLGSILGVGALGFVVLFGIMVTAVSVWYIIYAFLKTKLSGNGEKPKKGNYTLDRIRKA